MFSLDIYKTYINKEATEIQTIKAGKNYGYFLAIMSMSIAPLIANAPQGLFGYLQEVNGCYSIPILTIILVGIFTKYVPAIAAKIAILSGVILYSISQFILKPFVFGADDYPHYLHVMAILFLLNVAIMLVIGNIYPRKEAYKQFFTHAVDITPWKYLKVVSLTIIIVVIAIYAYFSG